MKYLVTLCAAVFALSCAHTAPATPPAPAPTPEPVTQPAQPEERTVRDVSLAVFGTAADTANPRSSELLLTLADANRSCDSDGQTTTCCGGNTPGEKSDGICCTFGGWTVACEIVTCMSDGHCYDHEG